MARRVVLALPPAPPEIRGLGPKQLGPLGRCMVCPGRAPLEISGTWLHYGRTLVCAGHAWRLAGRP